MHIPTVRRSIYVSLLAVSSAVGVSPAHAQTLLPFSGDFQGGISYTQPTPTTEDIYGSHSSTDALYDLDQFTSHYFLTITGNDFSLTPGTNSTFTFATTNGSSSIYGIIASETGSFGPSQQQFSSSYTITGGTGEFSGSTGAITVTNGSTSGLLASGTIILPNSVTVPEPSSFALLGLAAPALGLMVRRARRKANASA